MQNIEPLPIGTLQESLIYKDHKDLAQFAATCFNLYQKRIIASKKFQRIVRVANKSHVDVFISLSYPGEIVFQGNTYDFRATFCGDFEKMYITHDANNHTGKLGEEKIEFKEFIDMLASLK